MFVKIDAEQLLPLIKAFYELAGIKIAMYDNSFAEVLTYPEEDSDFCTMLHSHPSLREKCSMCTARLCRQCADIGRTIVYKCHAGLTEVVAPLAENGVTIGYVVYGQITDEADRKIFTEDVRMRCREYGLDQDQLEEQLSRIRYCTEVQMESTVQIISALTSYIMLKKLVYVVNKPLDMQLREYIEENLSQDLSVSALCRRFAMSRSELYSCTKECMPEGIARYVRSRRVEAAHHNIEKNPDKPLWKVAEEAGFESYEYFLRMFKAQTGISAYNLRKNADGSCGGKSQ